MNIILLNQSAIYLLFIVRNRKRCNKLITIYLQCFKIKVVMICYLVLILLVNLGMSIIKSKSSQRSISPSSCYSKASSSYQMERKLTKLFKSVSHHIFEIKQTKIKLLQQIDQAFSQKISLQSQFQSLQRIQTQKEIALSKLIDAKLIEQLRKRVAAQQHLKQLQVKNNKKYGKEKLQYYYAKAERLQFEMKQNLRLQSKLNDQLKIEEEQNSHIDQQIYSLHQQKRNLLQKSQKFLDMNEERNRLCSLDAFQLIRQNPDSNISGLVNGSQYDSMTTLQMMQRKESEQIEKELLYESIKQMKNQLCRIKQENIKMEQLLKQAS